MTVDSALHCHAKRQPSKAAVQTADRRITYAELDASVSCLAHNLLGRGLLPGDRVAVHWSNSIETVQLLLAAFRAGLVAVPINLRLKSPEIAYMFEHSSARALAAIPCLPRCSDVSTTSSGPNSVRATP